MSPILKDENAFDKALREVKRQYREELTTKELAKINTPTNVDDLLSTARHISKTYESQKQGNFTQLLGALDKYGSNIRTYDRLLEGVCKLSPAGGELLWGSIMFVFEMARYNVDASDQVLSFFTTLAQRMDYLNSLENTFAKEAIIAPSLESTYISMIKFWAEAVKHSRTRGFSRVIRFLFPGSVVRKFKSLDAEIQKQMKTLENVAAAQHYQDEKSFHGEALSHLKTEQERKHLAWIAAPAYEQDYKKATKKRHEGTCEWILSKDVYNEWQQDVKGRILVIYGIAGAGKTILSSLLIKQSSPKFKPSGRDTICIYHYFKADDETKNTPLAATRSFLEQLYLELKPNNENDKSALSMEVEARSYKRSLTFEDLWAVFRIFAISSHVHIIIILDAMDECKGPKPFIRELHNLCKAEAVKVVITARKDGEHVEEFRRASGVQTIDIQQEDLKRDIASFVKYKINKIERLKEPKDRPLRENVIADLGKVENHGGMFLWAYLMCKDVKDQISIPAIWKLLQELPKGLDAVYIKILKKLNQLPKEQQDFSCLVLKWIVGSSRPLRFPELEQALRQAPPIDDLFDDDEGECGLRWSRKDIVRVCGSLVSYSGLEDGDVVSLIHLSTRDFLKSDPRQLELDSPIAKYFVDIFSAEIILCNSCLDFLLSEHLHRSAHFRGRQLINRVWNPPSDDFLASYPFFDYAVLYWSDYALDVFETFDHSKSQVHQPEVPQLERKISKFSQQEFSTIWLEEYIRQVTVEFAYYTFSRFQGIRLLSPDLVNWTLSIKDTLNNFGLTISKKPQTIHRYSNTNSSYIRRNKIIQETHYFNSGDDNIKSDDQRTTMEKADRAWLEYEPRSGSLYSARYIADTISLSRVTLDTKARYRAAIDAGEVSPAGKWVVRSAVIRDRGSFIAITFCPLGRGNVPDLLFLRTVCWSVISGHDSKSNSRWAEIAFIDRLEDPGCSIFRHIVPSFSIVDGRADVVAFGDSHTLIAPGGIWNILTEEKVARPTAIYEPDPSLKVSYTCFSGNGNRVARVSHQSELQVLDIKGNILLRHEFPVLKSEDQSVHILAFSPSGKKLILWFREDLRQNDGAFEAFKSRRLCFYADEGRCVELHTPPKLTALQFPKFNKGENFIIGRIPEIRYSETDTNTLEGSSIALWTLPLDPASDSEAQMVFLFKSITTRLTFSFMWNKAAREQMVILADSDGSIHQRPLKQQWSADEEEALLSSRHFLTAGGKSIQCISSDGSKLHMALCSNINLTSPNLTYESWTLGTRPPHLIMRLSDTPKASDCSDISLSHDARYIGAKGQLFSVDDFHLKRIPIAINQTYEIISITFCGDESRFALVGRSNENVFLEIYTVEILKEFTMTVNSTGDLAEIRVTFDHANPSLLIYSFWTYTTDAATYVLDFNQNDVIPTHITAEFWDHPQISLCGKYAYNVDRAVLSDNIAWPTLFLLSSISTTHSQVKRASRPTILRRDSCYVHKNRMFRFRPDKGSGLDSGFIFLDVLNIGEFGTFSSRTRIICVKPDEHLKNASNDSVMIWPPENAEDDEVKFLMLPTGNPVLIRTGIRSEELLQQEDEWVANPSSPDDIIAIRTVPEW
ncbi:MAG: hypothetical protein M1834_002546 [Cirrosporium novae-zelandiae]|nr:MAG: hypothetical protein M1834_002546 [Cirrosporium novae-zelandiae]